MISTLPPLPRLNRSLYKRLAGFCNSFWRWIVNRPSADDIRGSDLVWDGPRHPFSHLLQGSLDTSDGEHPSGFGFDRYGRQGIEPEQFAHNSLRKLPTYGIVFQGENQ